MFQILINREEKENFFFKILKIEKRKRMKIQFFRARGSERGQYFSRFLEIRDSCPCLFLDSLVDAYHTPESTSWHTPVNALDLKAVKNQFLEGDLPPVQFLEELQSLLRRSE